MEVLFRDSINEKIFIATYDDAKGEVISNSVYSRDISENMLPKKSEFFELSNSMITDYIGFLSTVEGLNMNRIKVVWKGSDNGRILFTYNSIYIRNQIKELSSK